MAVIHDMIPAFELFQPADTEGAVALLRQYGDDAWVLAGGLDSMDWFKDRAKRPKVVVDVGGIAERGHVAAVVGFGHGDRGHDLAACETGQPGPLLVLGPAGDAGAAHVLAHELFDAGQMAEGHRRLGAWLRAGGTWERPETALLRQVADRMDDLVNFLGHTTVVLLRSLARHSDRA